MDMTQEERRKELAEAQGEALRDYFSSGPSIVPGCLAVRIKKEIEISAAGVVLNSGVYFLADSLDMKGSIKNADKNGGHVYLFTIELKDITLTLNNNGKPEKAISADGAAKLVPIRIEGREDPISLSEAAGWAAINDAEESGDSDRAHRLFKTLYNIPDKPVETTGAALIKQDTNKLTEHVQGISRVAEQWRNIPTTGEQVSIRATGKNEAREVLSHVILTHEENGAILNRPMTGYDKEVHDAVASLWAAGNKNVTARQVYQAMTGSTSKPSAAMLEKVEESVDKQRRTLVKIDFSQELRGKTAEFDGEQITPDSAYIETYMLNAVKGVVLTTNGKRITGYELKDAPVLYRHDKTIRQLISVPQTLLEETSRVASNTETNILIRSYLIKRIKTMNRNGQKLSKRIRYESVYKAIGNETDNRTQRKRMNETVRTYLDAFVDSGFIAGWTEYKDPGRSHKLLGVTISTKQAGR